MPRSRCATTAAALIDSLVDAKAAGQLSRRLRVLTYPALLVVDEIGYLPVSQDGAVLFFQLINARHSYRMREHQNLMRSASDQHHEEAVL